MAASPPSTLRRARDGALQRLLGLPEPWLRRLTGGDTMLEGQRLDAQLQALLAAMRALRIRNPSTVGASRRAMDLDIEAVSPPSVPMRVLRELRVVAGEASLPARLYVPRTATSTPPLLVYFHGGGFVVGSLRSHDAALRELADLASVAILSVEYRLAPENKAPTAAQDAHRAFLWARAHAVELGVDASRIAAGGDSAGGNVTAVLSQLCRDRGEGGPDVQLLIYPATDLTCSMRSHQTFGQGFLLESTRIDWYLRHYLVDDRQRREPSVSPLFAKRLDGLPPAIVVTAGFDPLRDEGKAYADALREAGVAVTYRCETSLVHGFFNMSGVVDGARTANVAIAKELRRALSSRPAR